MLKLRDFYFTLVIPMFLGAVLAAVPVAVSHAQPELVVVRPDAAERFVTLPDNVQFPEGLTVDPATGEIYVATFNPTGGLNWLLRLNQDGKILAMKEVPSVLAGLAFNPHDGAVYIAVFDFGLGSVVRIDGDFDSQTPIEFVASLFFIGAPADRLALNFDGSFDLISFDTTGLNLPNGLTFSYDGDLYVSESFNGAIFRINDATTCPDEPECTVELVIQDGLLATANEVLPVGANGLAFDANDTMLYVANTGDDRILRLDVTNTSTLEIFAESVDGADGIAFDEDGILWVAADQSDEVIGFDQDGRIVAELGEFLGIENDGSIRGLLVPASLAILRNKLYVTNLALPFAGDPGQPEEDVRRHSVSRITIPNFKLN